MIIICDVCALHREVDISAWGKSLGIVLLVQEEWGKRGGDRQDIVRYLPRFSITAAVSASIPSNRYSIGWACRVVLLLN